MPGASPLLLVPHNIVQAVAVVDLLALAIHNGVVSEGTVLATTAIRHTTLATHREPISTSTSTTIVDFTATNQTQTRLLLLLFTLLGTVIITLHQVSTILA